MVDIKTELTNYRNLGAARQLAATPGMTLERGKELGSKYRKQHDVRSAKYDRVVRTIKGEGN